MALPSVVPTTKGPLEVTDADGPKLAATASVAREAAMPAPAEAATVAPMQAEPAMSPPATMPIAVAADSVMMERVPAREEISAPLANEVMAVAEPDALSPMTDAAAIEPVAVAVAPAAPEPADAAVEGAGEVAALEDAGSDATLAADAEAPPTREESPLA
jgi:ribonuclease E